MKYRKTFLISLFAVGLYACSDKPQENVFQPQVDAYNKSKKVEGQILKQDEQRRKQIERDSQ